MFNLKAIRESKALTQNDVAQRVHISQASYCNIEIGARRPSVDSAKRIAAALGFDWTLFYEETGAESDSA